MKIIRWLLLLCLFCFSYNIKATGVYNASPVYMLLQDNFPVPAGTYSTAPVTTDRYVYISSQSILTAGTGTMYLEYSNDGINFEPDSQSCAYTAPASCFFVGAGINTRYIRLRFEATSDTAVSTHIQLKE